ncbi:MAG: polymerase subunit sigma-70 [Gammaproteobacteria bacterium]|nr:polymerase subunit sigma-70 [Gammaproteobacteria bacterium]
MSAPTGSTPHGEAFDQAVAELRPRLHRYCARMTGSVIDGEDVVQEALMKAIEALPRTDTIAHLESWLVRIAHNAALDFLRRRSRRDVALSDEDLEMIIDPAPTSLEREIAAASLTTFMRLPVAQRSSVILMDVLGYSLEEITGVTGSSIPAIKAALHRGRARLRDLAQEQDDRPEPVLAHAERSLLAAYVDRFNARDFDALRDMLADEVQLDLVTRTRRSGRTDVSNYFSNYVRVAGWHVVLGFVERRPAVVVRDPADPTGTPLYFILLEWAGTRVVNIRDFRYARYVIEAAELTTAD